MSKKMPPPLLKTSVVSKKKSVTLKKEAAFASRTNILVYTP
jgi:hypothetical protein